MFSSHSSEPMVDERRLSDPGPGNNRDDVDILACPGTIQKSDILLSTKQIGSCNRQFGYRNLLGSLSCRRLTSSSTRSCNGHLLQGLTSDSKPCVDGACYRRYRLEKFARILKAPPGIFLKEHFKKNDHRLWDVFELFEWYQCVLMLVHHLTRSAPERCIAS